MNEEWKDIKGFEGMQMKKYKIKIKNPIMGVPITFLDKYNPEQFEIVGMAHGDAGVALGLKPYPRELKKLNKGMRDGDLYYMENGIPVLPYRRILIRKKVGA